jgi:hypothetical protein
MLFVATEEEKEQKMQYLLNSIQSLQRCFAFRNKKKSKNVSS